MKKSLTLFSALFLVLLSGVFYTPSRAQSTRTDGEITDGREYWIGIPHCLRDKAEAIRWGIYPIELWVSSKVKTKFKIESLDGSITTATYELTPNKVKVLPIPDFLENIESEIVRSKGIHIVGDDPLNVAVFVAYKWSGEAFRCTPVEWLGKEYYSLNMYQDYVKMASGYTEYKPSQILIIATEDKTSLKYTPKAETDAGVQKDVTKIVKLNKGETFLIEAKTYPNLTHDWRTDLSGTHIEATAPVAVVSGHTKGAFPRFKDVFLGSLKSDFMRNMLIDAVWPVELLGKEYLSAPIKYIDRTYNQANMIEDFKGDLIRFVATQPNTIIYQMRQDGSGYKQISPTMKSGDWFDLTNQEQAALYRSTKPVLVGQYGKAWWSTIVENKKKDNDQTQNPPRNGQGMMFCLTPIEQWTSYAVFRVPFGMDNFVYFTFKTEDFEKLYYDGKKFSSVFGSVFKQIEGTPYSYVTEVSSPGDHFVEGKDGGKFAGYAYGNWDMAKDGFAYGYPIGINYAVKCEDSLDLQDKMECGDVFGTAFALPKDSSCARIFNVQFLAEESTNYTFTREEFDPKTAQVVNFSLLIIDHSKYAKGVVKIVSRSGKALTKTYEYFPEEIEAVPTAIDFGLMTLGEKRCQDLELKNPGRYPITITVKDIRLKFNKPEFKIEPVNLPLTIEPGKSAKVTICATALKEDAVEVVDSLEVSLSCYDKSLVRLEMRTSSPIVWISDATWLDIPVGVEKSRKVKIVNEGTVPVEVYSIDWVDKTHFLRVEGLDFPLKLNANQDHEFTVWYKPDKPGVVDKDSAIFTANTTVRKLYSIWIGNGIEAGPFISGYDWFKKRVIDDYSVNKLGVTEYEGSITIDNYGNTQLDYKDIVIENDFAGVFRIDKSNAPLQLKPNNPITLKVFFAPKTSDKDSFEEYLSKITFIAEFNGEQKTASAELHGIEMQPHIGVTGHDYGPPIIVGNTKDGDGSVISFSASDLTAMPLTIFSLSIEGQDKNSFEIDPNWLVQNPYPIVLTPGANINVPIKFTAIHAGDNVATLVAESDAPENPKGDLIGRGLTRGTDASDKDFGIHFITQTTAEGTVFFTNTGTEAAIINDPISVSGADQANFRITKTKLALSGTENPTSPITVIQGDTLYVYLTFTADVVRKFNAKIEYKNTIQDQVSNLAGEGMILKTIVRIPDNYIGKPGDKVNIDVMIDKHQLETKQLEQANIQDFKVIVYFKPDGRDVAVQDVYPAVAGTQDILTAGTMTEGWTVDYAKVMEDKYLVVHFTSNQALKGNGVLFRFPMQVFLSDISQIPLPVELEPIGTPWVEVEKVPGLIKIEPVCVNTLRLIKISGVTYTLSAPSPNPASGITTIDYSVALEAQTTLAMYDSYGRKVATLVNEVQEPGKYQYQVNVSNLGLPSGAYYIKLESGPYNGTEPLVIAK